MSWHRDRKVNQALIRLMDELVMWERETGRRITLLFIPHHTDEDILMADSGKPITVFGVSPERLLQGALKARSIDDAHKETNV